MGGLPELGIWRGEITLRPGTSYAVRGVLPRPEAPTPAPTPSHHGGRPSEPAATRAPGTAGAPGGIVTGAGGAPGARAVGGAGGDTGAAVEKPYRPPPDSGILFLDLQGGAPRAP
jgi:hypothetical protein